MSGILSSGLGGPNSNLQENTGRAFANSYPAQSGSSSSLLNQSGGNIQGLHNIHGSFNLPNMPAPYASMNLANLGGLPNSVQQAPGSISSGRYTMNSVPNAMSQIPLGSTHGHLGVTNTGGQGVLSNMGNAGRMTNVVGGPVKGGNISRGANSGGVALANISGLASRMNLNASQVMPLLSSSYPGPAVPLSQNHFQTGNNNFSYMALLNDSSLDNANFDLNDFPQLAGRPPSAGGSHGQIGLMQKHNLGFTQQNQEFSIQNEDFPALPGYKGGLNIGGSAEYTLNAHPQEQIHDSMSNFIQTQQLSMGRPSGFNFGNSYSPHHPQQHHASAINSSGVSYLTPGNQDLHFHGPEQYQYLYQIHSRFMNPYRDKETKFGPGPQGGLGQYGMAGLLSIVKVVNPLVTSLAMGTDLTTLGLNLNSAEALHPKFASPWSDEPVKPLGTEYKVPECYYAQQPPQLKPAHFPRFRAETLFYIFYSMPRDEAQLFAANELHNRGWFYHREIRFWFTRVKNMEPLVKTNSYERGCYICFDPNTWQTIRKDNFVLQYDMVERRPILPQQKQQL